jgi:hypothetical protein
MHRIEQNDIVAGTPLPLQYKDRGKYYNSYTLVPYTSVPKLSAIIVMHCSGILASSKSVSVCGRD